MTMLQVMQVVGGMAAMSSGFWTMSSSENEAVGTSGFVSVVFGFIMIGVGLNAFSS